MPWLAWGWANENALGDGIDHSSDTVGPYIVTPAPIVGSHAFSKVLGSGDSAIGLESGQVWTWGLNGNGILGQGSLTPSSSPTPLLVSSLSGIVDVAAGAGHFMAIGSSGQVWSWGTNNNGQLGLGDTTRRTSPTLVTSPASAARIFAGNQNSALVDGSGQLWVCGRNTSGKLGLGATGLTLSSFVSVSAPWALARSPIDMAIGSNSAFVVLDDGTLWACGDGTVGALGLGGTTNFTTFQQNTLVGSTVTEVIVGFVNGAIRTSGGAVYTWGGGGTNNAWNDSGPGTAAQQLSPHLISGVSGSTLAHGEIANNALLVAATDGTLWGWGDNQNALLLDTLDGSGFPTPQNDSVAAARKALSSVQKVAVGGFCAYALSEPSVAVPARLATIVG